MLRIITLEIPFGKYSLVTDKHGETVGAFVRKGSVARDKVPRLTVHTNVESFIYISMRVLCKSKLFQGFTVVCAYNTSSGRQTMYL